MQATDKTERLNYAKYVFAIYCTTIVTKYSLKYKTVDWLGHQISIIREKSYVTVKNLAKLTG